MRDLPIVLVVTLVAARGERNELSEPRAIRLNRTSVFAAEAGLLGLFAVFVAFASFGPLFTYWVGLVLFSIAIGFGVAAIALAHRAAHTHRRDPRLAGRRFVTIGSVTGWMSLLVGSSYLGLPYLVLHPLVLFVGVPMATLAFVLHLDRRQSEASFLRSLNLASDTAACGGCGRRIPLAVGRWAPEGWLCPNCGSSPWGVSA